MIKIWTVRNSLVSQGMEPCGKILYDHVVKSSVYTLQYSSTAIHVHVRKRETGVINRSLVAISSGTTIKSSVLKLQGILNCTSGPISAI